MFKKILKQPKELLKATAFSVSNLFKGSPWISVGLLITTILTSVAAFAFPKALELSINALIEGNSKNTTTALIFLIAAFAVPAIISAIHGIMEQVNYIKMQEYWLIKQVEKQSSLDLSTYENANFQTLLIKVKDQGIWPVARVSDRVYIQLQNIIQIIIAVVITTTFDWRFLVAIFIGSFPNFIFDFVYGKRVWGIWDAEAPVRKRFWNIYELLSNKNSLIDVKLNQGTNFLLKWMKDLHTVFTMKQVSQESKRLIYEVGSAIISAVSYGYIIYSLFNDVQTGLIKVGALIFALSAIQRFESQFTDLLRSVSRQYKDALFVLNIIELFEWKDTVVNNPTQILVETNKPPHIVFEHVTFAYDEKTKPVLKDVSFEIKPGDKVAFVGNNGAGKTTIIKLINRVYDPTHGRILIDGIDLKEIDIEAWRSKLAVLFQDYTTFEFPVKDLIGFGNSSKPTNLDEVHEAAKNTEADQFINVWKDGYDQVIGRDFDGVEPSKGQKQKLALARTWYRNAPLIILDEPTSAVDAESEQRIFDKIESLPKTTSAILISHRFSTVRKADTILVIEEGTVKEKGNHAELIALKGRYAELFSLQKSGYEN